MPPAPDKPSVPPVAILLLIAVTLAFGSGWPIMKYGVVELPILTFRWLTAILSGLAVLILAACLRQSLRLCREEIGMAALCGLFNVTGWFYFTALALSFMTAGRSSVLAYTMPLFAFLAGLAVGRERITPGRILGLLCGLGAVAVLSAEDFARFGETPLGVLAILAGAACWGIGTVMQKRVWRTPVVTLAGWQLVFGGLPLLALALALDSEPYRDLTLWGAGAVAYTVLIGNMVGFVLFLRVVAMVPASVATLGVLPVPLVGITSGAILLGEPVGWAELSALALITVALATVLPMPRPAFLRRP